MVSEDISLVSENKSPWFKCHLNMEAEGLRSVRILVCCVRGLLMRLVLKRIISGV